MPRDLLIANVLFDDRVGGPQRRVVQIGRELRQLGVRTALLVPEGDGDAAGLAAGAGLDVSRIRMTPLPRIGSIVSMLRWAVGLALDTYRFFRGLRAVGADLVHVNGAFFLPPALAAKLADTPLLWHLNDTAPPRALARVLGIVVRALADGIAVTSSAPARHYGIPLRETFILHPPVDVERIRPGAPRPSARSGERVVTLVANWNPIKGVDDFLHACSHVLASGHAIRICLAGKRLTSQPGYARKIESLLDDLRLRSRLLHCGFAADISQVLAMTDVLVMTSRSEAGPMSVLEAMAAGLPVVATDVGASREYLLSDPSNPAGIVVPVGDSRAIAGAVAGLLDDAEAARRMGEAGRSRAVARYSLAMIAKQHAEIYSRLCGR